MAKVTLRPDGTPNLNGWTLTGAATLHEAASDDSDASYAANPGADTYFAVAVATVAIPALAQIRSLTPRIRFAVDEQNQGVRLRLATSGADASTEIKPGNSAIATWSGPAQATHPSGAEWTQADIDAVEVEAAATSAGAGKLRVYELYLDVVYNEAPVATVTAPADASTISNDSQPSVTWTYSDPESDAQERYRVKVFSAAQYGAGGFDPSTSTAAWDSGEVLSAATTVEIATVLPNATYRAYVQVADVGSGGRFGAWDYNQFTLNVTGPAVPTFTATADNTLKRVELVATSAGVPAVEFFDFEYSDDSGATWAAVRGATRVAAVGTSATVYDYEAPPNTARQYRAKSGRAVA